eukprot:TRINITY_DN16320_c0_g1_i1.p1 TRINITY_DN16320_c0_g1~~TRINITY_DN16320_c0_g1_i1.p1  ORF type:complete len:439 (+),score=101.96 TRINITY_DN16320_c0_g1_i1:68-1318(+)
MSGLVPDPPHNTTVLTFEDEESAIVRGVLLFLYTLLFVGLAGNADRRVLQTVARQRRAIASGLFGQFIILPWTGCAIAATVGRGDVVLGAQVLLTSIVPGGAVSVFYCTIFNCDLELSIVNTFIATLASAALVPLNCCLYVTLAYGADVTILWLRFLAALLFSLAGMALGLVVSAYRPRYRQRCVQIGAVCAVLLIIYSLYEIKSIVEVGIGNPVVFLQVFLVCTLALVFTHYLAVVVGLTPPQVTSVAIVCSLQTSGLAMNFAAEENATESQWVSGRYARVCYHTFQNFIVLGYAVAMWKKGRTHAPKDIPFLHMVANSYRLNPWEADLQSGAGAQQEPPGVYSPSSTGPENAASPPRPKSYPTGAGSAAYSDSFVKRLLSDEDRMAEEKAMRREEPGDEQVSAADVDQEVTLAE